MRSKTKPTDPFDTPTQYTRQILAEQILWLIRLRWMAAAGMVLAAILASLIFPVLTTTPPIYICAAVLLLTNAIYFYLAPRTLSDAAASDIKLAFAQVETDLLILTAVLHFAGGVANPFIFFYFFHIIIATIILPRHLSYFVGLTAIALFGLLAINELNAGAPFGHYPLNFSVTGSLWRNPVYALGGFVAFTATVILAQYLTRIIIVRMTAKELEAARNSDVLNAVISAMAEGLIFINSEGKIVICNPAAKKWIKTPTAKTDSPTNNDFTSHLAEFINKLSITPDKLADIKFETTENPTSRYIEATSSPVTGIDDQPLGHVIVGQDLTDHKKLEKDLIERTDEIIAINEMLKMSRIEMAHREKMVAMGQMATGIAHEIGNPLASLSSVAQYLARKLKTHEEKEMLLVIDHQVDRISGILKRMLNLSRPATTEYKWSDINEIIDTTLSLVKFDKRMKTVTVKNSTSPHLPNVWLNPQLFEQVLINLIINAIDAMNARADQSEHILTVTSSLVNKKIEVRITDTGIGMSKQTAKRAFESFFTTKEIGKGTGLGLFISYNLITEIDGTIELESEPNIGTTAIIRIPLRAKKELISDDAETIATTAASSPPKSAHQEIPEERPA